jgi:hypothetical protein
MMGYLYGLAVGTIQKILKSVKDMNPAKLDIGSCVAKNGVSRNHAWLFDNLLQGCP